MFAFRSAKPVCRHAHGEPEIGAVRRARAQEPRRSLDQERTERSERPGHADREIAVGDASEPDGRDHTDVDDDRRPQYETRQAQFLHQDVVLSLGCETVTVEQVVRMAAETTHRAAVAKPEAKWRGF